MDIHTFVHKRGRRLGQTYAYWVGYDFQDGKRSIRRLVMKSSPVKNFGFFGSFIRPFELFRVQKAIIFWLKFVGSSLSLPVS